MDRFIATRANASSLMLHSLKSNMDRFIVTAHTMIIMSKLPLKSNMDRFIGRKERTVFIRCFL